jgi:hypothetical protein
VAYLAGIERDRSGVLAANLVPVGASEGRIVLRDGGHQLGRNRGRRLCAACASGFCDRECAARRCASWPGPREVAVSQRQRAFAAAACACLALTAAGCDGGEEPGDRKVSLVERQAQLDRDPYAITCGDIEDKVASTRLSKRVQYALADDAKIPGFNRLGAGQSIFFAMTELCKGKPGSYKPANAAIEGVRRGEFRADVGAGP